MNAKGQDILFSGTSHPNLAHEIARSSGLTQGKILIENFPDGEISVQIQENIRGRAAFVIQTVANKPNHYLMELLIIIDALKRASASSIIAVIPYYGYARQDRKDKNREPITAKLVANLLEKAGANRVLTMDLHSGQIQGFFDIPVDNLFAKKELIKALKKQELVDPVVVAPDLGSIKIAKKVAEEMNARLATIDKSRVDATHVDHTVLIGDVKGSDVILADDMCSTAGTLVQGAKVCKEAGAKRVFSIISHGLFVGNAIDKLKNSEIEKVIVSNTLPQVESLKDSIFEVVSIGNLFGDAIECIISAKSISSLIN